MLMCRGMEHNLGVVFRKYLFKALSVTHGTDKNLQLKLRQTALKLHLKLISIIFINIKNDKHPRIIVRYLAAQLAAYASSAARYQNNLSFYVSENVISVNKLFAPSEKLLRIYLPNLVNICLSACKLIKRGHR